MPEDRPERCDIFGTPFPPYASGEAAELRWNQSLLLACGVSYLNSPVDHPDMTFIWTATRALYNDESFAAVSKEQHEAELAEAHEMGIIPTYG